MNVITVTSLGQNPASFISNFSNSIQLSEGYEIGLLKIACPPIFNVSNNNNKLYVVKKEDNSELLFEIPQNFYPTTHDLAQSIYQVLASHSVEQGSDGDENADEINFKANLRYHGSSGSADHSKLTLQLIDKKLNFRARSDDPGNILDLLEFRIKNFSARSLVIQNYDLTAQDQICFIYSSIVSNSLIDYNVSRLLDTVPIKSSKNGGYYMLEVQNPVFHDISSSSFIDINFDIRNVFGDLVQFVPSLPVILTLGLRKKQNFSI